MERQAGMKCFTEEVGRWAGRFGVRMRATRIWLEDKVDFGRNGVTVGYSRRMSFARFLTSWHSLVLVAGCATFQQEVRPKPCSPRSFRR